jgi:hypothetical protein
MGVCPSEGDQSALQAFVTGHTDDVAGALAGGPLPNCAGDLATCNSDLAAALACGNGAMNVNEDCDQANLDGKTCLTQGFAGGTLACSSGCLFDTSGCWLARFTDNADGTITDNEVGFMWEKKTELDGSTNFPNAHDADNHYPWAGLCSLNTSKYCQPTADAATLCAANAEGGTVGCDECTGGDGPCSVSDTVWTWAAALDTAAFAAHNDWRLPKRRELEGILDLAAAQPPAVSMAFQGPSCGGACTDIRDPACSCTWSANYWSASAYAAIPGAAWILYFGDGSLEVGIRTNDFYVRAVRSVP